MFILFSLDTFSIAWLQMGLCGVRMMQSSPVLLGTTHKKIALKNPHISHLVPKKISDVEINWCRRYGKGEQKDSCKEKPLIE